MVSKILNKFEITFFKITKPHISWPTTNGTNEITDFVILDKESELKIIDSRYVSLTGRAKFQVTSTPDKENFTVKLLIY